MLVVDVRTALASPDMELARLLRRLGKPLFLAVNKVDSTKLEAEAENFRTLGIENFIRYPPSMAPDQRNCWTPFLTPIPCLAERGSSRAQKEEAADTACQKLTSDDAEDAGEGDRKERTPR